VDITSEQAKTTPFSGTEHSYDAREVEEFRRRVIATLAAYETAAPVTQPDSPDDLNAAQRARHQAVELAERMLRDVMGASGDEVAGLATWQEAAVLRAMAEEEKSFAEEEFRRLVGIAMAEREELRSGHDVERNQLRADLQRELQNSRDVADAEVAELRSTTKQEADEIVRRAVEKANEIQGAATAEVQRLERRLAVLHSAVTAAENRFRRLAATAANEVGTMQAILDEDVAGFTPDSQEQRPDLYLASIDLTDDTLAEDPDESAEEEVETPTPGMVPMDPDVGFYQRRLAGLRDRLEKSGYTPE
jgi:hypothetical protein